MRRLASKCRFRDLPKELLEKYFPDTVLPKDVILKKVSGVLLTQQAKF